MADKTKALTGFIGISCCREKFRVQLPAHYCFG
jgi:hypothetical protein